MRHSRTSTRAERRSRAGEDTPPCRTERPWCALCRPHQYDLFDDRYVRCVSSTLVSGGARGDHSLETTATERTGTGERDGLVSPARTVPVVLDPLSLLDEEFDRSGEFQSSVTELPGEVFWAFLGAVLLAQVGLFAASLGLMLVGFRGQLLIGGSLLAGGTLALGSALALYRWVRTSP